jgi:predicted NAD/FAD-dependent oxidoreductase
MDANRELVMQHLIQKTSEIIGHDANEAVHKTIHGWRYANNVVRTSHPAFIDRDMNLGACGDWCVGGRVEGAFTSAFNLFNALKMNTA